MSYDLTIGPVARAASVLRAGGVIAYPTEAVWGLGCDPHDESAFRRVIGIKRRAPEKGVILVTGRLGDAEPFLEDSIRRSAPRSWQPGRAR